ncbi:DUF3870 domain-containing protein [Desulfallas sp. Bu1-1]|uniref:DUF3870 domain-containing protein n=1 Tax=Desulfallas sp. Bu1-1 TaxID=2787620 RepID=UPI00189F01F5|nr:DUF3870 domain-containing protein [Desulfallas sp. Bu1-1]MBF7084456.1 DUF3870 domain-containing protein [Desulfallas sp. Bu1-1]
MGLQRGKTHLFSGHAQLPKGIPMQDHIQRTTALLEIDIEREIIVRASFMTVLPHTGEFLSSIAEGYDLSRGIEPLVREMEERAHVASIRAFTKAVEIAYQKYMDYKKALR